ncbi:restriction endonuclease subunit S [Sphingobacterium pedocola]|uniref:Restriction endonuclease subunit S n=1 Tax=Sphingobacterium pedocola TaxID=2082722 RepID=A0ABR9T435_9SPHI|nr:restriction endonuclease subunit S [Sphingobacterium pedocola]MBE8719649.1 restriction endonuclease subunit S [Sphingobacterium pedocola]
MQRYEKYKDSGIDWLGKIPEHWELNRLKHIFKEKKKVLNFFLPAGSISFGKVVFKDDEKIPASTKATYQEVLKGDYLINPLNLNYDLISLRIALSDIDVVVSSGYIVIQDVIQLNKNYYKWLLHQYDISYMKLLGAGVRQTINFNNIANSELPYPPLNEQKVISKFLDDKCEKIDVAIHLKERQIEKLSELRQITIQNAVTKGIQHFNGEAVQMKNSGIDWIGDIPEHWSTRRLASLGRFSKGGGFSKADLVEEDGVPAILYGDIYTKYNYKILDPIRLISVDASHNAVKLEYDDLLFTGSGELKEDIGKCVVFKSQLKTMAGGDVIIFRQVYNSSEYLSYCMSTNGAKYEKAKSSKGEIIVHTYASKLREIYVPFPPINEQRQIVAYLDEQTSKMGKAIAQKQEQIIKLKEYKKSLINEVVTGKLKVVQ